MALTAVTRGILSSSMVVTLLAWPAVRLAARDEVTGRLVDADTGQPIGGAVVTVGPLPRSLPPLPTAPLPALVGGQSSVRTTPAGAFVLSNVLPHNAFIGATADGYVPGAYGQRFLGDGPLAWDDRTSSPLVIRLTRAVTIAGQVRDEHGDPIAGEMVQSLRKMLVGGEWRYSLAAGVRSDNRGLYRLTGLVPGEYLVAATDVALWNAPLLPTSRFRTTFFRDRTRSADATALSLAAGELRANTDLTLTSSPCVPVTGILQGVPLTRLEVDLERAGAVPVPIDLPAWRASSGPSGRFAFPCVDPGEYHVKATTPSVWFNEPLTVGAEPITDQLVPAVPLSTVTGRLVGSGGAAHAALFASVIRVVAADGAPGPLLVAHANVDGFFRVGLPPGRYVLSSTVGRQVTGVRVGTRGTADGRVVVGSSDLPGVVLAVGQGGDVAGRVDLGRAGWRQVSVYVFPQDQTLWTGYGQSSPCLTEIRLDHNRFYSAGLPAGAYFIVAVTEGAELNWRDPVALARLAGVASPFDLADGQSLDKDLKGLSSGSPAPPPGRRATPTSVV
jgi:hypothetical protein